MRRTSEGRPAWTILRRCQTCTFVCLYVGFLVAAIVDRTWAGLLIPLGNIFAITFLCLASCICPSLIFLWGEAWLHLWMRCVLCCQCRGTAQESMWPISEPRWAPSARTGDDLPGHSQHEGGVVETVGERRHGNEMMGLPSITSGLDAHIQSAGHSPSRRPRAAMSNSEEVAQLRAQVQQQQAQDSPVETVPAGAPDVLAGVVLASDERSRETSALEMQLRSMWINPLPIEPEIALVSIRSEAPDP
jgi:hypothetical protein